MDRAKKAQLYCHICELMSIWLSVDEVEGDKIEIEEENGHENERNLGYNKIEISIKALRILLCSTSIDWGP